MRVYLVSPTHYRPDGLLESITDYNGNTTSLVYDSSGKTVLPPYWIKKFNNVKVGFIGMTLEATDTLVAAAGIQGVSFKDEAQTANALVPILQAKGVQAIIESCVEQLQELGYCIE